MKAGILRYRDGWHIDRLAGAMAARGVECVRLSISELTLSMGGGGPPVSCGGADLRELDAVIVRIIPLASMEQLLFRMNALHRLAALGVRVINHPAAIEKTVDKSYTSALLADAGFAAPRTVVCESFPAAMEAFEDMGDVIVKPLHGSCGAGMLRVSDRDMAYRVFRTMEMSRYVYYLQEFVESGGSDVRVFVAGGQAVADMRRTGKGWKANFNAGGKVERHEPPGAQADEAVRAAALLGVDYAGVDFLRGPGGEEYVIEVNGIPGWKGLQSVTDIDIAERIVDVFAR